MDTVFIVIALVLAYLIGSFPSAFIVGRLCRGMDIRKVGSRNMGAMNTFYSVGFWWGILVLFLDIGKGALAVAAAWQLTHSYYIQMAAGLAAVLGHNFPVFLKFKGGKGGASCIGILVYLMPWGIPIYPAVFGLSMLITRFPTLSYSLAFLCFPFIAAFLYPEHKIEYIVFSIILLLIPLLRYIPRIREMHGRSGGSWKHVAVRKNLKDRL
ncbi:MAG: glycerol-3-phosphate acyltransferase [Dehalococcoidales bacterium]|nr:glycerol-3-phosphate acyltransferase [Dehalococcoidales bacterium]